eukprot:scaffold31941_cov63-Phaeocystis_antarctica.AAC.3
MPWLQKPGWAMSSCSSTRSSGVSSPSNPRIEARVRRADMAAAVRAAAAMPTEGTGCEPADRAVPARMAGAMSTRPRTWPLPPCCTAIVAERIEPIEWPTRIVGVRGGGEAGAGAAGAAAAAVAAVAAAGACTGVAPDAAGAAPSSCSATAAWKDSPYLYSCVGRPLSPKPSRSWAMTRMGTSPWPRAESAAVSGSMNVSQVSALAPKP